MNSDSNEQEFINEISNSPMFKCFKCRHRIPLINSIDFTCKGIYITIICQCDDKNFSCYLRELLSIIKHENTPLKDEAEDLALSLNDDGEFYGYKCFNHKKNDIDLYCYDCTMGICYKCTKNHIAHQVMKMNELWFGIKEQIRLSKGSRFHRETMIKTAILNNDDCYEDMFALTKIIYGMFYKGSILNYNYILCKNMLYYESCFYTDEYDQRKIDNINTISKEEPKKTIMSMKNYLKGKTISKEFTFVKLLNPSLILYYHSNTNKIEIEDVSKQNSAIIIDSPSLLPLNNCYTNNTDKFALTANNQIYLYTSLYDMITIVQNTRSNITSIIFINSTEFISTSSDYYLRIYKISPYQLLYCEYMPIYYLTILPTNGYALTQSDNRILILPQIATYPYKQTNKELIGHQSMILKIIEIKEGQELASCSCDKDILIWNIKLGIKTNLLKGHCKSVNDIIELKDKRLASSSHDHSVKLWDMNDYTCVSTLSCHTTAVVYLRQLSKDTLFTVSSNNDIIIYE